MSMGIVQRGGGDHCGVWGVAPTQKLQRVVQGYLWRRECLRCWLSVIKLTSNFSPFPGGERSETVFMSEWYNFFYIYINLIYSITKLLVLLTFSNLRQRFCINYHAYKYSFALLFPIWMPFVSFPCVIALFRTSCSVEHKWWELITLPCSWSLV